MLSLILLAGSLLITIILWNAGVPAFFLLLFIPLIPFFQRTGEYRECPLCGWRTTGSERFCPRDGSPLGELHSEDGEIEKR